MKDEILKQGYVRIDKFMTTLDCNAIIDGFRLAENNMLSLEAIILNDSSDLMNKVYSSSRSPLRYCYLKSSSTQLINQKGIEKLNALTGWNWCGNINDDCFPIFEYQEGGFIEAHRGRDIGYGRNDYVAVLMLTEYGVDYTGGDFYLNKCAVASEDGKVITNDNVSDRMYFQLSRGDLLIFNNRIHVHATTPVQVGMSEKPFRMTTSWRMEEK